MSTCATLSEAGTLSPESLNRARASTEPSDKTVSTGTETGAGFGVVLQDLPGREVTGGSGMDKLERVWAAIVSVRDCDLGNFGDGESIVISRML